MTFLVWKLVVEQSWLMFLAVEVAKNHVGRFLICEWNTIPKGLPDGRSDGDWLGSGGCWKLWMVESMSFSGHFKLWQLRIHSWKKAFGVDAWQALCTISYLNWKWPFVPTTNMALIVEEKPFFRLLSVHTHFSRWWSVLMVSLPMNGEWLLVAASIVNWMEEWLHSEL